MKTLYSRATLAIFSIFLLSTKLVFAEIDNNKELKENLQALGESAQYKTDGVNEKTIFGLTGSMVGIFLGLLGVIFVALIIIAGYNWMMAGGDTAKLDKAKDSMWRAIIGLLIITGAYAIQSYVFGSL